jgi:vesicular inhibitory amino acid transporter
LFSCLCIFLVTLGDHLHSLYPNTSEAKHMVHVAMLLTVPTALLRTPKLLSYLSVC